MNAAKFNGVKTVACFLFSMFISVANGEQPLAPEKTRVLFVCTGNYYRSRFAEAYLKFVIEQNNLPMETFSRGVAVDLPRDRDVSPFVVAELAKRNIPLQFVEGFPQQLSARDLQSADIVVGLNRAEHQTQIEEMLSQGSGKARYWNVRDGGAKPSDSCATIATQVKAMVLEILRKRDGSN